MDRETETETERQRQRQRQRERQRQRQIGGWGYLGQKKTFFNLKRIRIKLNKAGYTAIQSRTVG